MAEQQNTFDPTKPGDLITRIAENLGLDLTNPWHLAGVAVVVAALALAGVYARAFLKKKGERAAERPTTGGEIPAEQAELPPPPAVEPVTGPRQLPADLADFAGREWEIAELEALLSGDGAAAAIAAIGGMGGVGKSALAVHVAHRLVDRYPDGQLVVDMGGASDEPLEPVAAMARVIHSFEPGARLPDEADAVAALYRSLLSGKRALIVLDNASDGAQVRPLMPPPPSAAIVTSRQAIALEGVRSFNLDTLSESEAHGLLGAILGPDRVGEAELAEHAVQSAGRAMTTLRKQVEHLDSEIATALKPPVEPNLAGQIRAHWAQSGKALTGVKAAIDDGDTATMSAVLSAPAYLSGLTDKSQAALRLVAAAAVAPDMVAQRGEAADALARVERATDHFMQTIAGRLREWRDEDATIIQESLQ